MRVYLDYHASAPLDKKVIAAMEPFYFTQFGNPSSAHIMGEEALDAVEKARGQVATLINAEPQQIYFTSGATEANNIAITGKLLRDSKTSPQLITSPIEHNSVLATVDAAVVRLGLKTFYLPIYKDGSIDIQTLCDIINFNDIDIVSIMMANNETGIINNIAEIVKQCKKYDIFCHTDATQAIGKINIDVKALDIDALSLSAHKICGPKGVGALFLKNHTDVLPLTHGGYQNKITSGTMNVPGIVGLGKACELLMNNSEEVSRIERLRNQLLDELVLNIPKITINGTMQNRLCNNLNISIDGVLAEAIIMGLDDVIVSGGSACESGKHKPSYVLLEMGVDNPKCAIRFGLGRWTTDEDIKYAVRRLTEVVKQIRNVR